MFEPGEVVVCVESSRAHHLCGYCGCMPSVTKGTYYKVYDCEPHPYLESQFGVMLDGIPHWFWCSYLFRKVEKSSEDIFKMAATPLKLPAPKELEDA